MSEVAYLPTLRALVSAYQAFVLRSDRHIRAMGLTPPQFDIIATLGNTPGMTPTELTEKTLITKGSLTGVLDRMIERGWVERVPNPDDRRSQIIRLTSSGNALFKRVFPDQLAHMAGFFSATSPQDHARWQQNLNELKALFEEKSDDA